MIVLSLNKNEPAPPAVASPGERAALHASVLHTGIIAVDEVRLAEDLLPLNRTDRSD